MRLPILPRAIAACLVLLLAGSASPLLANGIVVRSNAPQYPVGHRFDSNDPPITLETGQTVTVLINGRSRVFRNDGAAARSFRPNRAAVSQGIAASPGARRERTGVSRGDSTQVVENATDLDTAEEGTPPENRD